MKLYVSNELTLTCKSDLNRYRQFNDALDIMTWMKLPNDKIIAVKNPAEAEYIICYYTDEIPITRTQGKYYYFIFKSDEEFNQALMSINVIDPKWSRFDKDNGYEVSSRGDRRFSPFFMYVEDDAKRGMDPTLGPYLMTLEDYYHLRLKGYGSQGYTSWKQVKGLPPLDPIGFEYKVYNTYKSYLNRYRGLLFELAVIAKQYTLTDMFDVSGGQNKIYTKILNEIYGQRIN